MNNVRRKNIKMVIAQLKMAKYDLQRLLDEEQDYFDNMPENLQNSMRAMDSEEYIEMMEDAIESLEEIEDSLSSI